MLPTTQREQRRINAIAWYKRNHPEKLIPFPCKKHGTVDGLINDIIEQGCPICYDEEMDKIGDPPAHGVND